MSKKIYRLINNHALILIYCYLRVNNKLIIFDNLFTLCYIQAKKGGDRMKQIEVELTEVETQRLRLAERIKEYRKHEGMR